MAGEVAKNRLIHVNDTANIINTGTFLNYGLLTTTGTQGYCRFGSGALELISKFGTDTPNQDLTLNTSVITSTTSSLAWKFYSYEASPGVGYAPMVFGDCYPENGLFFTGNKDYSGTTYSRYWGIGTTNPQFKFTVANGSIGLMHDLNSGTSFKWRTSRATGTTSWAENILDIQGANGTTMMAISAYGSGGTTNAYNYLYLGSNAWNGDNLRIYSTGATWGSTAISLANHSHSFATTSHSHSFAATDHSHSFATTSHSHSAYLTSLSHSHSAYITSLAHSHSAYRFYTYNYSTATPSQTGWYRIVDCLTYPMTFIISFGGTYNNLKPPSISFVVHHTYTDTTITQLGDCPYIGRLKKLRAVHHDTYKFYLDFYYDMMGVTSSSNRISCDITALDYGAQQNNFALQDPTIITSNVTTGAECTVVADISAHSHSDYAASAHSHSFATTSHSHSFATTDHSHSMSHSHSAYLTSLTHSHSAYLTSLSHSHSAYAASDHSHSMSHSHSAYYKTAGGVIRGNAYQVMTITNTYTSSASRYPCINFQKPISASADIDLGGIGMSTTGVLQVYTPGITGTKNVCTTDHSHSDFALNTHTHLDYSTTSHSHSFATTSHSHSFLNIASKITHTNEFNFVDNQYGTIWFNYRAGDTDAKATTPTTEFKFAQGLLTSAATGLAYVTAKGFKTGDGSDTSVLLAGGGTAALAHSHSFATTSHSHSFATTSHSHSMSHSHSAYLPTGGGNVSGHIYLIGAKTSSSTGNTSQIVFGTSGYNHVAVSSNLSSLIINPSTSTTTGQIQLKVGSSPSIVVGSTAVSLSNHSHGAYSALTNAPSTTALYILGRTSGSVRPYTYGWSGPYMSGTNLYAGSDISLKKDITPISGAYIEQLFDRDDITYSFRWKDSNAESDGFIAQYIEDIMPEVVDGQDGNKHVNYDAALSKVVGALFKRIKEDEEKLKSAIKYYDEEISKLKEQVSILLTKK